MPTNRYVSSLLTSVVALLFVAPVFADVTPPSLTYTQTPSTPNGSNSWYVTPVQFNLTATDLESGVQSINYRIDNGTWQTTTFDGTLNLAPNPSFETASLTTTTGLEGWEATVIDAQGVYTQDITTAYPGYGIASAKIVATGGAWHGINNKASFAVATPYENMTASVWVKTPSNNEQLKFKVFALRGDGTEVEIAQSTTAFTNGAWVKVSLNFAVTDPDAIGVYLDIGMNGNGTAWLDAVNIDSSATPTTLNFTVATDRSTHTVEFYATDNAANASLYSCTGTKVNCVTFKLDQTPPGNWNNAGAFRGLFGASHELYVYTNVEDATSGLSVFTDKYQYKTDNNATFGRYSNIFACNSTWQPDQWVILISPPFQNGVNSAYLLTPKTDFCNSNWKVCKIVKFYAADMAGNSSTKDFCINGPWIRFTGEGVVRSNNSIDMLAEAEDENTDGLIESGTGSLNFFTSSRNWEIANSTTPKEYSYDTLWDITPNRTQLTTQNLNTSSGVFYYNGNFEAKNQTIPNNYNSATFNQIVYINGDLKISNNLEVANNSTALFIVKGKVEVAKTVTSIKAAIIADGDFYTAYDIVDNDSTQTLVLRGFYSANNFEIQRTLQGTNNDTSPSEDFIYEPKYLIQLKNYFDKRATIWKAVE